MNQKKIEEAMRLFLEGAGVSDPIASDLPQIVARDWPTQMLCGYEQDPAKILSVQFAPPGDQTVIIRDIAFTSVCCHHLLPFFGRAAVAYVPGKGVTGLSSLARLVDCFARRLQTQERMTEQIVEALMSHLGAKGAACRVEATQLCLNSRGPEKESARVVTTAFRGVLADSAQLREEFLRQAI